MKKAKLGLSKKEAAALEIAKKVANLSKLIQVSEGFKEVYNEIDRLTVELAQTGIMNHGSVVIVDNFATKNTAFKTTAIKRFEAKKVA